MAMDTAPPTTSRRPGPPRQLWQVPTFLLGVAAAVGVLYLRPPGSGDGPAAAQRRLREARIALDRAPAEAALQAAQRAAAVLDFHPQFAAEAHFLLGSAHLRRAADPAVAAEVLKLARDHLEQAERAGVADADRPKLNYRLAKARALLGDDAAQVMERLRAAIDAADDPAEGYGLLAQTYLRLNPPNLRAALEATDKQLGLALPTAAPRTLAAARFRRAELQLMIGGAKDAKEARAALEQVGTDAAPEQFYAARVLLAQSYEQTQEWAKAALNWGQARTDPRLAPAERGRWAYRFAHCCARDGRTREAAAAWEDVVKLGGAEARAARLRLAELALEAGPPAAALEALDAALAGVAGPADYDSALIPLDEARALVERAAKALRAKGDFAAAQRVADLYARLAGPAGGDDLTAQTADTAADALAEQIKQAPPEQVAALEEQARGQSRLAAQAYAAAADKLPPGPEQADRLWRAAHRALKAGDVPRAIELLQRLTLLETAVAPEKLNEAWYVLGEAQQARGQAAAARAAFEKCLTPTSAYRPRARVQVAFLDLADGKYDDAESALKEVESGLRTAPQLDAALLEKTLFALAEVAYQRQSKVPEEQREYGTAQSRLEGALQEFPASLTAERARFMLGRCHWAVAVQREVASRAAELAGDERQRLLKQRSEALTRALEQFDKVEELLRPRAQAGALPAEEASRLRLALFSAAECCFHLSRFEEAIKRNLALAERFPKQIEELAALSQLWQCHIYLQQPEQGRAALGRLQAALEKVPDPVFNGSTQYHHKAFWTAWLADAAKLTPAAGQ